MASTFWNEGIQRGVSI